MTTGITRWAWLPIPLLLALMLVLWAVDAPGVYESPFLVFTMNFATRTVAAVVVAYLAGRSFLACGVPGLVWMGCGATIWGGAGLVASTFGSGDNFGMTVTNLGAWLAGLCHLAGVMSLFRSRRTVAAPRVWLAAGYALAVGLVALLTLAAQGGWLPVFFVQGQGGTTVRYVVLVSAITTYALAAVVIWEGRRPLALPVFASAYLLALLLMVVGLFGMLIETARFSWLDWTCRVTQYTAAAYLLAAAVMLRHPPGARALQGGHTGGRPQFRYAMAIAVVLAATALRLACLEVLGSDQAFVTFYPAVVLAALYGGIGSGLLATALTVVMVRVFWVGPPGVTPAGHLHDWIALGLYVAGSVMITWLAEALRRARLKAAEVEAQLALATERELATDRLRRSEEKLALAASATQIGMFERDLITGDVVATEQNVRVLGLRPTPTTSATTTLSQRYHYREWAGRVHAEDLPRVEAEMDRCMREHVPFESEYRVGGSDGSLRWVAARGVFQRDADGKPRRLLGILMDITDRKRAEEAAAVAHRQLQSLIDNTPALVYALDLEERFVMANAAVAELLKSTPESILGKRRHAFMPKDDADWHEANDRRVIEAGRALEFEEYSQLNGRAITWLTTKFPLCDAQGTIYAVAGISADISARKQAEAQVAADLDAMVRLQRVGTLIVRDGNLAPVLAEVVDAAIAISGADFGNIQLLDPAGDELRIAAQRGFPPWWIEFWNTVSRGRGACGTALERGERIVVEDVEQSPIFVGTPALDIQRRAGVRAVQSTPLISRSGKRVGMFSTHYRRPTRPDDRVLRLLDLLARQAADIIDRSQSEEALREAMALATASQTAVDCLESMGEGLLLLDMQGRILAVNPALQRIMGMAEREMVGRPALDLIPDLLAPDDAALVTAALAAAVQGRTSTVPPVIVLSRSGRRVPVMSSVTFVKGVGHRPRQIVVSVRDISELRAAYRALEESNALLERIFDDTHVLMAYLDTTFKFVRVNRAYAEAGRKDAAAFVGRNHFELYPHAGNEAIFRRVLATGVPYETSETAFPHPGQPTHGTAYWDWSLQAVRDEQGRVDGLLLCLLDATDRVKARVSLIESERKYRELVENASSIILRVAPDLTITFFNEYAQAFFGYTAAEVLGKPLVGTIVPEVDSEGRDLRATVQAVAAEPDQHGSNESENVCKDGRRVWVQWANRAVRDSTGKVIEILSVGLDVTRRREMEAEAQRYQQRLRELTERLAATEEEDRWRISRYIHDTVIQNLSLASIRLESIEEGLRQSDSGSDAARLRDVLTVLDQAGDECRTIMSDLTPALLYELGLCPALNDLADRLQAKHGIHICVAGDAQEKPMPSALRGLIFESARELIMNALKYAGPCEIRVGVRILDGRLTLSVADNGRGFDPAAEAKRDRPGGFGLFSIRQRLAGLSGRLDIVSASGRGTTATITLPISES